MRLRRFNNAGILEFRHVLAELREDPTREFSQEMLEDSKWTDLVTPSIDIVYSKFSNRRDAAIFFHKLLTSIDDNQIRQDAGLWTWLTVFFFDDLCPRVEGNRTVKNDYYYIYDPHNIRHFYRHLLYISWQVLSVTPKFNRLFLDVPLNALDKATGDVMKRLYLTRIPCVFEVLDRIYWDRSRERIRKGMVNPRGITSGDLIHRFPACIRQLEMTYDLQSLSAGQMLELLGGEFQFDEPMPSVKK